MCEINALGLHATDWLGWAPETLTGSVHDSPPNEAQLGFKRKPVTVLVRGTEAVMVGHRRQLGRSLF